MQSTARRSIFLSYSANYLGMTAVQEYLDQFTRYRFCVVDVFDARVGRELRRWRSVMGLSPKKFAAALGITAAQLADHEAGRLPMSLQLAKRAAEVTDLRLDDLVGLN